MKLTSLACLLLLSLAALAQPTRNVWRWPFAQNSIWNMPVGSGAQYSPAYIKPGLKTSVDPEYYFKIPAGSPKTNLYAPADWQTRCGGTNSTSGKPNEPLLVDFPENWLIPDARPSNTPTNCTVIVTDSSTFYTTNGVDYRISKPLKIERK
jgi:hypothetical protein